MYHAIKARTYSDSLQHDRLPRWRVNSAVGDGIRPPPDDGEVGELVHRPLAKEAQRGAKRPAQFCSLFSIVRGACVVLGSTRSLYAVCSVASSLVDESSSRIAYPVT